MRQAHLHSIAVIQRIGQYKYQNCNDMLAKKMPRKRNPFRDVEILSFDGFKVEEKQNTRSTPEQALDHV